MINPSGRSASELVELGFPGYAIGGLSVGEAQEQMDATLEVCHDLATACGIEADACHAVDRARLFQLVARERA